ncbi:MAG TPA: phage tail tape measure protein [Hyphomicrobiaceae bacterium]|nr:phage tail tape measure protein [Hyphomicrobiaceae bacterium]
MPDNIADWQITIAADTSSLRNELQRTSTIGRQFSRSMISAFEGIAVQGRSLGDVVRNLGLSLSRMVLSTALKPLDKTVGSLLGNIFGSGMGLGFAKGGVLQQGTPIPFAKGGVIASPVAFPLAGGRTGLAGERGPEAIMPLTRTADGRLGVATAGSAASSITINIATPDVESFARSETQIAALVARALGRAERNL